METFSFQRKVITTITILITAAILSGCIKSTIDMTIKKNDTIDGTFLVALSDKILTISGKPRATVIKDLKVEFEKSRKKIPKGATADFYDKDGYVGQLVKFKDLPAADFTKAIADATFAATAAAGSIPGSAVTLVKKGTTWEFGGTVDLADLNPSTSAPGKTAPAKTSPGKPGTPPDLAALTGDLTPDLKIKVTFPGKIISKDQWAKISGNTASWAPKAGEKVAMKVVAKAS